jgi:hypothetical protein
MDDAHSLIPRSRYTWCHRAHAIAGQYRPHYRPLVPADFVTYVLCDIVSATLKLDGSLCHFDP